MNLLRITDPQIASPTVSPANRINKVLTQNPFMPRQQSRFANLARLPLLVSA